MVTRADIGKRAIIWDNYDERWRGTNGRIKEVITNDRALIEYPNGDNWYIRLEVVRAIDEK